MPEELVRELEEKTCKIIKRFLLKGRILDAGVGYGGLLSKLPEYEKYGKDISTSYLEQLPEEIVSCFARLENLPYKDNFFDGIICTDVLEHLLDLNPVISEIIRVTKKGGFIFIRVPLEEDLSSYLAKENPYDLVHLRSFCEAELILLFTKIFSLTNIFSEKMGFILNTTRAQTFISKKINCQHLDNIMKPNRKRIFFKKKRCDFKILQDLQAKINDITQKVLNNIIELDCPNKEEVFKDFLLPTELMTVFKK